MASVQEALTHEMAPSVGLEVDGRVWQTITVSKTCSRAIVSYWPCASMGRLSLPWSARGLEDGAEWKRAENAERVAQAIYEVSEGRIRVATSIPTLPPSCSYLAILPGADEISSGSEWGSFIWEHSIEAERDYFMAPKGSAFVLYSKAEGSSSWRAQASSPSIGALENYLTMLRAFTLEERGSYESSSSGGAFERLARSYFRGTFHRIVPIEGGKVERPFP